MGWTQELGKNFEKGKLFDSILYHRCFLAHIGLTAAVAVIMLSSLCKPNPLHSAQGAGDSADQTAALPAGSP